MTQEGFKAEYFKGLDSKSEVWVVRSTYFHAAAVDFSDSRLHETVSAIYTVFQTSSQLETCSKRPEYTKVLKE